MTDPLESLPVGSIMTSAPACMTYDMTVGEATRFLVEQQVHGAPVVGRDGLVLGVLSGTDILEAVGSKLFDDEFQGVERVRQLRQTGIGPLVTAGAVTCSRHTSVGEACRLLIEERIHRLVVVSSAGDPVGVVTPSDVVRALAARAADAEH